MIFSKTPLQKKIESNPEISAYFLAEEEMKDRKIHVDLTKDFANIPIKEKHEKFLEKYKKWTYSKLVDEFRPDYCSKFGGIELRHPEAMKIIRSIAVDLVTQIGKKLISGDFNLTTVSIHIRVMQPFTILQTLAKSIYQLPIYLNLASVIQDPLERFKLVVVATLASFTKSSCFIKPLNPILGETYDMDFEDGSKLYTEQTSHHPPISHFYLLGPNKLFKYYGFGNFITGGGLNCVKVFNKGKRTVEFSDGTKINFNYVNEIYNNAFFGTARHESVGDLTFKDEKHGFELTLKMGSILKKPSDYFQGEIKLNNIILSKAYGSFVSFVEFDNIRYYDIREHIDIKCYEHEVQLLSSSIYREDRLLLSQNLVEKAQIAKEKLENIQRADRKLRQKINPTETKHH